MTTAAAQKKGPTATPSKLEQSLEDAVAVLTELGPELEESGPAVFAAGDQPRDANGRFAKVTGAKATVAKHVGQHLVDQGHKVERVEGSTVHLKGGGSIEIGNKGERTYKGTQAKVQHTVEQHLRTHADKSVRDWASKTTPAPPAPRVISPERAAAREKAKKATEERREKLRAERDAAKASQKQQRAELAATRSKAIAERQAAREAKRAEQVQALQAVGAPVTADGKIDAAKVPGATASFTPPTSSDPENSFRGRSYIARSAKEMKDEFLGGVGKAGSNEDLLNQVVGGTTKHAGGVRDAAQWDAVRLKYEQPVETFDEAFAVLAKAAAAKNPTRKPDWRDFDITRPATKESRSPSDCGSTGWATRRMLDELLSPGSDTTAPQLLPALIHQVVHSIGEGPAFVRLEEQLLEEAIVETIVQAYVLQFREAFYGRGGAVPAPLYRERAGELEITRQTPTSVSIERFARIAVWLEGDDGRAEQADDILDEDALMWAVRLKRFAAPPRFEAMAIAAAATVGIGSADDDVGATGFLDGYLRGYMKQLGRSVAGYDGLRNAALGAAGDAPGRKYHLIDATMPARPHLDGLEDWRSQLEHAEGVTLNPSPRPGQIALTLDRAAHDASLSAILHRSDVRRFLWQARQLDAAKHAPK